MSDSAHSPEDDIAFFAATIGRTTRLDCGTVAVQTSDADGPLPPGRYLIHAHMPSNRTLWVATGKFEIGGTLDVITNVPYFPMRPGAIIAIEFNVRKNVNDRIAAILGGGAGTATLFITRVSRGL